MRGICNTHTSGCEYCINIGRWIGFYKKHGARYSSDIRDIAYLKGILPNDCKGGRYKYPIIRD